MTLRRFLAEFAGLCLVCLVLAGWWIVTPN